MALRLLATAACLASLSQATPAAGQSLTVELTQTGGYSTEDIAAAAAQLRAFGDAPGAVRYNVEAAWGARSNGDVESDVFGGAYPYDNRVQFIEAYAERTFQPGRGLVGLRAGRYRTPFGISSGSDHAYYGFLRPPLIRYDDYYALSNNFLEQGADLIVGTPRLSLEASAGVPADVGDARRRSGLDTVLRAQGYAGSLIAGASYIRTRPYQSPEFAHGVATFAGVDVRWMRSGIQLRGEWITGRPFDGTTTTGGYGDLIVHRPGMGPVTAVFRAERLDYVAEPPFDLSATRFTAGSRIRLLDNLALSIEIVRQRLNLDPPPPRHAVDVALTYSLRRD
jgi:hypothetical protein